MKNAVENDLNGNVEDIVITGCAIQATDIPDVDLTPAEDGTIGSSTLKTVYDIFLNQSGDKTARPANEGNKPQYGKIGKITYELDGGTITGAKNSYGEEDYGYVSPTPTKKGYKFTGWTPANLADESTGNVTFTTGWEESVTTIRTRLGSGLQDLLYSNRCNMEALKAFQKSDVKPSTEIKTINIAATGSGGEPVYAWFESDTGTIKYWSNAKTIYLPENCAYFMPNNSITWKNLIDISGFIGGLFYHCANLTVLSPIADWDASNVENLGQLFQGCTNLTDLLPVANWHTSNAINAYHIFDGCSNLTDLSPISDWDMSNVKSLESEFAGCANLEDLIPIGNWNASNITTMQSAFQNCTTLVDLTPIGNRNVSNVTNMGYIFKGCQNLTGASGINDWNIASLKSSGYNAYAMFSGCPSHPEFTKREGRWDNYGTFYPAL